MRTGYRLALVIAIATVAMAGALVIAELLQDERDPDAYGKVSVPGRESVTLPAGDVVIYYGEAVDPPESLGIPDVLRLEVLTTNGEHLVGSTPYRFEPFSDGDHARRSVAKLDVPESGQYEAVSRSRVVGAAEPEITFGKESSRNWGYALFVLAGGLLLAGILAGVTFLQGRREG